MKDNNDLEKMFVPMVGVVMLGVIGQTLVARTVAESTEPITGPPTTETPAPPEGSELLPIPGGPPLLEEPLPPAQLPGVGLIYSYPVSFTIPNPLESGSEFWPEHTVHLQFFYGCLYTITVMLIDPKSTWKYSRITAAAFMDMATWEKHKPESVGGWEYNITTTKNWTFKGLRNPKNGRRPAVAQYTCEGYYNNPLRPGTYLIRSGCGVSSLNYSTSMWSEILGTVEVV